MMSLELLATLPFFQHWPAEALNRLAGQLQARTLCAGEVLYYQGDPLQALYILEGGRYSVTQDGKTQAYTASADAPSILDLAAALGGLVHSHKWQALEECCVWQLPSAALWEWPDAQSLARRYLAEGWSAAQARYAALSAPITYDSGAELPPGPFRFQNVTMIFAFCEGDSQRLKALLPPGLSLLQRPYKSSAPLLIALADFPHAQREDGRGAVFGYTETTFFIPVRQRSALGFYVPMIFPSAYEPILLGRELYGFPKRLGQTEFKPRQVELSIDSQTYLELTWQGGQATSESELVGALGAWLGLEAHLTSAAFQASEVLRKLARLPRHRRVDVYNHKKNPSAESSQAQPRYAVNQLTRATFGVLQWHQVTRLEGLALDWKGQTALTSSIGAVTLQRAYRTQLELRLGLGRVVKDYLQA
jgi:hypothetical protein